MQPTVVSPSSTDNQSEAAPLVPDPSTIEVSIVVPTVNEIDNIGELVKRVALALQGIGWEIIFVDDDSSDGTAEAVRQLAVCDRGVRVLLRINRRGLSSACIEGMLASAGPYIAVMDADLQHDERLLPQMVEALRIGDIDVVVGSRYVAGGSVGAWAADRAAKSRLATRFSRMVLRAELTDPMSGFFMIRREVMSRCVRRLSSIGFKVLFDIFASSPEPLRYRELPYVFRARNAGESKLDTRAVWDYGMLLLDKLIGHAVPVRFIAFSLVGCLGVIVHFGVLTFVYRVVGLDFVLAQAIATMLAMTFNFLVNNLLTFRDQRLKGWQLARGWLSFSVGCSIGALANVGIASFLFREEGAGWVLSALAGVLVGAVWNYAVTSLYTWKVR
jgi:dolichol-phosphate mannosyltransferase